MTQTTNNRGSGNHNTSATTFGAVPTSNCTANAILALFVAADNSVNGGATNNMAATATDNAGNTWYRVTAPVFDNGATSAGVQGAVYYTNQSAGTVGTGTTITVTFADATTAKTWTLTEVVPTAGFSSFIRTSGDKSAGATNTACTLGASASCAIGDVIIAGFFIEGGTSNSVSTPDADGTNGAWTTNQYNEIGTTISGSCIVTQAKIQTTTPSTQTLDITMGVSNDYHGSWVIVSEVPSNPGGTMASSRGGWW